MLFEPLIIQQLENLKKDLQQINQDLTYEEVLQDKKLTLHLQKQAQKLAPIVEKFDLATSLFEQNHSLDEKQKEVLKAEIDANDKKIEELKAEIVALLNALNAQKERVTVEICPNDNSLLLSNQIVDAYSKFLVLQKFEFEKFFVGKNVTFEVCGPNALKCFENENGLHKSENECVEVCVFVSPQKKFFDFDQRDLKIEAFHSSGAGGQNVNKVSTAIRATHLPSGICVVCQNERSQLQNKIQAIKNLKEKIEAQTKKQFEDEKKLLRKQSKTNAVARKYFFDTNQVFCVKQQNSQSLSSFLKGKIIF